MEKINFTNGQAPSLNGTNLNQLQANVESAIAEMIESGSNANGKYIKYSDGTMICSHNLSTVTVNTTYHYTNVTWAYPVAFKETPYVVATPFNWNICMCAVKVNPGATNCAIMVNMLNLYDMSRVDETTPVNIIAIGKWK